MLDLVPGRRIQLAHFLEDALDDVCSGTGLVNILQVIIAPVTKRLVLYPCGIRGTMFEKKGRHNATNR